MTTQSTITPTSPAIATIRSQLQIAIGHERVDLLNELSLLLCSEDPAAAEVCAQEALTLAIAAAYYAGQATSWLRLGVAAGSQVRLSIALSHFETALAIFEQLGDEDMIAHVWNDLAIVYQKQGNYPKALEFCQKSAEVLNRLGKQVELSRVLNTMANLYKSFGDYTMSLDLYERSLQLKQTGHDEGRIPHILNNIGHLYREMGNPQQALVYLAQAEAILRTATNQRSWAIALNNIAWCHVQLGGLDMGEQILLQALETHDTLHNHEGMTRAFLLLAEIALARTHYNQAHHYANRALALAELAGAKLEARDAHQLLAAAAVGVADYQAAYTHYQRFHTIDHDIFNYH